MFTNVRWNDIKDEGLKIVMNQILNLKKIKNLVLFFKLFYIKF
jgi:hypothetical protein